MAKNQKKVMVFGSFNIDLTACVSRFPLGGESVISKKNIIGTGGKGANQALAAAKAGGNVHFVTKVGEDQFGEMVRSAISSSRIVSSTLLTTRLAPTGTSLIYISEQERENMIVVCPGANATVDGNDIRSILPSLEEADILLVQGENNNDATEMLVRQAKSINKMVILNPAPFSKSLAGILNMVDIITPNETEAALLAGIEVNDIESAKRAAVYISSQGPSTVIITLGNKGVIVYHKNDFTHIPVFRCQPVDTTGAGDAFNGAFVAGLADGLDIIQAATWACAFASLSVEREGAANHPDIKDVEERLVASGVNIER